MNTTKTTPRLTTYRRHTKACIAQGNDSTSLCQCTIWVRGRVSPDSEPVRFSLETADIQIANRKVRDLWRGQDVRIQAKAVAVREAARLWLEDLANPDRATAPSSVEAYSVAIRPLVKFAGDQNVSAVTDQTIRDFRSGPRSHLAPGTWSVQLGVISAFFKWCAAKPRAWREESDNPTASVPRPPVKLLATPPLTDDEVTRILAACPRFAGGLQTPAKIYGRARIEVFVNTLLYSGLRVSDAAQLRRSALNPSTGHLTLRTQKSGGRTQVKVQLPEFLVKMLLALPASNPEYFFWSGTGLKSLVNNLEYGVARLGQLAGVEHVHPHRFRDTFAVGLLSAGVDVRQVQTLLGHASVVVTEKHYAHFIPAHQHLLDAATARLSYGAPRTPVLMKSVKRQTR